MDANFKKSNYVKMVKELVPDIHLQDPHNLKSKEFPNLKSVVLIPREEREKGMLNFTDFYKIEDNALYQDLKERES